MSHYSAHKRPKKQRKPAIVVRETFSMPDANVRFINKFIERSPALATRITKSEIIRAGIHVLHSMDDSELEHVLQQVERLKIGRPQKTDTGIAD